MREETAESTLDTIVRFRQLQVPVAHPAGALEKVILEGTIDI